MSPSYKLILPLLLVMLALPVVGMAQVDLGVASLEIAIWPEYDRPGVLVIYQLRLVDEVDGTNLVTLPIPVEVGEPHAVAAWYPDGRLDDNVTWTTTQQGEWILVEVETDTNGVWLEFYDDLLEEGTSRQYEFSWPGFLAVDALSIEVLHPVGARDLQITPTGDVINAENGLTYTQIELGARQVGQPFTLELSYDKPSATSLPLPGQTINPALSAFEVALWPEYDQPAALIIYRGVLAPETALPSRVSIPIPASAGEPTAVAGLSNDNRLYLIDYERQVEGDWAWISFEADSRSFQVEHYQDLTFDGSLRSFTYMWPGGFETGAFGYEVQQPVGATALTITPAGVPQAEGELVYVRSNLGPGRLDSIYTISLEYDKTTAELTVDTVTVAPSIDRPSTTQGGTPELAPLLPYILGGFGVLLIGVGILLYVRMQRQEKPSRPRRRKRKKESETKSGDLDVAAVFCHVCGAKASASDHFCRNCGTKLRT